MGERFDVCEYSIDRLRDLIVEKSRSSVEAVAGKLHLVYFDEYFSALGAKAIVVENDYIDRDYAGDQTLRQIRTNPRWPQKKPLIRQAGSAIGLYGFCCHWQRTAHSIGDNPRASNRLQGGSTLRDTSRTTFLRGSPDVEVSH
jgi:hypothetical protein